MFVSGIAIFVCARGDAQARALCDAHAAAHHDAVHERDEGLAEAVDQVVEAVFLGEEVLQPRIAGERGLVEEADVAAGAEGAERALPALPADRDGFHRRIAAPREQDEP